MLSREDILGADDLQREICDVPEWGGCLYIRCLTGAERNTLQMETAAFEESRSLERAAFYRDRLLIFSLCDESNMPIFSWEDRETLSRKSGHVLERLFLISLRLNRLRSEDVELQTKNFEVTTNGVSGFD